MSTPSSTIELLDLVRKSGIVREESLRDRLKAVPDLPEDAVQSAAVLVKHGLLTRFQAKLLLTGRYRGFRLGSYIIHEQIGQGGMGAVYLAEHETLRRKVAVKVLTPPKGDPNIQLSIERFLREARAAAALDHPNIVRIHDVAQQGDTHFLVMEYVDGQTLEDMLTKGGSITPSRAVDYIAQAAAGLQHAYEKGFIHRDIKPSNLILARDGTVKILDMGLARSFESSDKLTQIMDEGAIVGTADFISPEQAMNNPNIDIRSDIYSLGATFYALVTGSPPFSGNTTQKLVQHQMKDAPTLDSLDKTFPVELAEVVAKMMAKKAIDRYKTPAEVISALAPWLPEVGATRIMAGLSGTDMAQSAEMQTTLTEIVSGGTKRLGKTKRNQPEATKPWALYAATGAAVLSAIGVVTWAILGFGSTQEPRETATPLATQPTVSKSATVNANSNAAKPSSKETAKRVDTKSNGASGNPAAASTKSQATRSVSEPVRAVVTQAKPIWQTDVKSLGEFRTKLGNSGPEQAYHSLLQKGMWALSWGMDAEGELFSDTIQSTPVLGIRNRTGAGSQILFNLDEMLANGLTPEHTYELRVRYATRGCKEVALSRYTVKPLNYLSKESIQPSEDSFSTVNAVVARKDQPLRLSIDLRDSDPNATFFLASAELVELTPVSGETKLYSLAFDSQPKDTLEIPASRTLFSQTMETTELPPGVFINTSRRSHTGIRSADVAGVRALGLETINGVVGSQLKFRCDDALSKLAEGKTAIVRLTYRNDGNEIGEAMIELQSSPYTKLMGIKLPPTGSQWKTLELKFLKPQLDQKLDFYVAPNRATGMIWIKQIEVVADESKPQAAAPAGRNRESIIYELDLSDAEPFAEQGKLVQTGRDKIWRLNKKSGSSWRPVGWQSRPWNINDEAEFGVRVTDGQPELFCRQIAGKGSMMFLMPEMNLPSPVCELEFEYQTSGPIGLPIVRFAQMKPKKVWAADIIKLEPTNGQWVTVTQQVNLKDATDGTFEVHLWDVPRDATLSLRRFIVRSPAPSNATTATARTETLSPTVGTPVQTYDFSKGDLFHTTILNRKPSIDLAKQFPNGTLVDCWQAESVAEIRRAEVAGKIAVGVTNLNDKNSSQVHFNDFTELTPKQRYQVRVTYMTKNDAVGLFAIRKPAESFATIVQKELPSTHGGWNTVAFEFERPSNDIQIDAQFRNSTIGEGNTVYLHSVEVFAVSEATKPATVGSN